MVRPLDDHMLIFDPRQQDEDFYFQGVRQRQRDLNKRASKDMQYMFDRVFHPHHNNQQLFEATTKDVIDTVIDGFNCSGNFKSPNPYCMVVQWNGNMSDLGASVP